MRARHLARLEAWRAAGGNRARYWELVTDWLREKRCTRSPRRDNTGGGRRRTPSASPFSSLSTH
ncbi:hypothetical protein [Actinomadura macra]|uniref:hypothetical protein n=1 Tax=Actinomadura macra TaxID=46164 RepID=UPI0012FCDE4B|nr:hypothetical protein [Actinomadura macra]